MRSYKANEAHGAVRAVVFSPDGRSMATGGEDRAVHIWDVPSGCERLIMRGHGETVSGLAFTPDGETILSISVDGGAISWDARTGGIRDRVEVCCGPLLSIAISADGRWVALGGRDGIELRNLESGRSRIYRCTQIAFSSLGFLPGGTTLASASLGGTIMLWKLNEEGIRPSHTLVCRAGSFKAMAVSHDGEFLIIGGIDGVLTRLILNDDVKFLK